MRRKNLIVGNWKMNPVSADEAKRIFSKIRKTSFKLKNTDVVICPPFSYISLFSKANKSNFFLGSQNAHHEVSGALTGEVSYSMLYQLGVRYVIVGHSERRKLGENDELINKKVKAIINGGMQAILCIGESTRDINGDYLDFIKNQIYSGLKDVSKKQLSQIIVAYEPIWAIGALQAMNERDIVETSIYIRKVLKDCFGSYFNDVRIIYGGSVDKLNASTILKEGGVSGLLIGRQSLSALDFSEILKSVDTTKQKND